MSRGSRRSPTVSWAGPRTGIRTGSPPLCRAVVLVAVLLSVALPSAGSAAPGLGDEDGRCDYAVTLALMGETARAESLFIAMLGDTPGEPRALNNLGNISLLRGETEVGILFYRHAIDGDSTDPGIHLNLAAALLLDGRTAEAGEEARRGVALAGGAEPAARLLGLAPGNTDKATEGGGLSEEEVRALIQGAVARIPGAEAMPGDSTGAALRDSTGAADSTRVPAAGAPPADGPPPRTWRSGGSRAVRTPQGVDALYWKR